MGFVGRPNKALANPCFKDQFGLIWGRETKREGEGEEKRKKKKRKKRRRGRGDQVQKGMETHLDHEF